MTAIIRRDNDPFKKYWWVILLGFMMVGGWVCRPLLEGQPNGAAAGGPSSLSAGQESLDSTNNPSGAPGGLADLSMGGSGAYAKKNTEGPISSSLYGAGSARGAPLSPAAAKAAAAGAPAAAQAGAPKPADGGWAGEKAQRGFTAPKGSFGAMTGLGSSGGGSSASAGVSAFGLGAASPGVTVTRGLGSGDSGGRASAEDGANKALNALRATASGAAAAAGQKSADAAASQGGKSFDGNKKETGSLAANNGASGAFLNALDNSAAPINLKTNFDDKKPKPVEAKDVPELQKKQEAKDGKGGDPTMQIFDLVMNWLMGGLMGGGGGSMFGSGNTADSGGTGSGSTTN